MLLDNWLAQRAQTCPDRCALIADGLQLSYAGARARGDGDGAAARLARRPPRAPSVAIELEAGVEYVVLLHALMKLGVVAYPVNTRLSPREREAELARARPVITVNGNPDLGSTEADLPLLGEHDLDAVHCRILTSGTSGTPRPVELTYGNQLWSAVGSAFNLGVEPTDRWLCCLPLFHVGGLSIVMRSVIYGTAAVVHDGFDVDRIAASLEGDGVTVISVVSTQLVRLLEAGVDLLPLRAVLVGGGPVPGGRARGGARPRGDGRPDLRPDRDGVAGDDARAAGGADADRLRGAAAADHPPADPRRRDPRPGPDRRARGRRRGRLAPHRRPRADGRRRVPLRRGPARRRDHHRWRERASRRGRGDADAPPGGRRRRRRRPLRPGVAGGGDRGRRPPRAGRRERRGAARRTAPPSSPATRSRSGSSSPTSCRGRRRGS